MRPVIEIYCEGRSAPHDRRHLARLEDGREQPWNGTLERQEKHRDLVARVGLTPPPLVEPVHSINFRQIGGYRPKRREWRTASTWATRGPDGYTVRCPERGCTRHAVDLSMSSLEAVVDHVVEHVQPDEHGVRRVSLTTIDHARREVTARRGDREK